MADGPIDQTNGQEGLSLRPGTRLGHYEVLSCIGSGGMGEVYVARDHHLARDVAIKVLRRHILERPRARTDFRVTLRADAAAVRSAGERDGGSSVPLPPSQHAGTRGP